MVRLTDHLNMTIAVDLDIKPNKQKSYCKLSLLPIINTVNDKSKII